MFYVCLMDLYQNFILELQGQDDKFQQLDVDPRSDDDASPMSSERFMLRLTRIISALWPTKSKYLATNQN